MIDYQLTTLTLCATIVACTINEKNRLNTLITPFTVTAWPFLVIAVLVNYFLIYLDFKPFTMRAQLFVLANLFILWLVGYWQFYFVGNSNIGEVQKERFQELFARFARYEWFLIFISWVAIYIVTKKVLSLFGRFGGFAFLGDPRFELMMTVGIAAHMGEVAKVCFILLGLMFRSSKNKTAIIMTMLGLFLAIAAMQVKYHLLWVLIILFIYRLLEMPVKKQLRAILWTSLSVILVMNLFWILLTIAWKTFSFTNKGIWQFLFEHTMLYITSAPVAFDTWLDFPDIKPDGSLLVVFKNIINVIEGNPIRISAMPFVTIGFILTTNNTISNVGTAYGVYYIIGGWVFVLFMTVLTAAVFYYIFFMNRKHTSAYLLFLNIFCLTLAALTFFVQYFTLLSFYEVIFLYLLFISIFKVLSYMNYRKNQDPNTDSRSQHLQVYGY